MFILVSVAGAVEQIDFSAHPMTAGKAALAGSGFRYPVTLGTANFSPDLRYPLQLIYNSSSEKPGSGGFGWSCPQIESTAVPQDKGLLWTSPSGEKFSFQPVKGADDPGLFGKTPQKGVLYALYSHWSARKPAKPDSSGDWIIEGTEQNRGWQFTYRAARLQRIAAPSGRSLDFVYEKNQLIRVVQNGQPFIELRWRDNLLTSTTINGIARTISYEKLPVLVLPKTRNGKGLELQLPRPVAIEVPGLAPLRLSYDESGYLQAVAQGKTKEELTVECETVRERLDKLDPNVKPAKKTSKIAGRLRADSAFAYSYGKKGISLKDKTGRTASYHYDAARGIYEVTDFTGRKQTTYYYERYDVAYMGQVRQVVDERGRVAVSYRYDRTTGAVMRRRDLLGNDTLFEYDSAGNVSRVLRQAKGSETPEPVHSIAYDAGGFPTSIATLDEKGQPVVTTKVSYTREKQPATVDNGQRRTSYTYNPFGYPVSIKNAFGQGIRRKYDAYNRLVEEKSPNGLTTRYLYDASGNVCRVEKRDGEHVINSADLGRDDNGRFLSVGDEDGAAASVERDAEGRIATMHAADDSETAYSYDPLGRLSSVQDENGHPITFEWGNWGLKARETAEGQRMEVNYDRYGRVATQTWKAAKKTAKSARRTYDDYDRVVSVTYNDGSREAYEYDVWGRVSSVTANGKTTSLTYDYYGRLAENREGDMVTRFSYNPWGQRTSRSLAGANGLALKETRAYDKYGRLVLIETGAHRMSCAYDEKSRLSAETIDGVPIELTYTKYNQLENKYFGGKAHPLSVLHYDYDKKGRIARKTQDGFAQNFSYDKKGQLVRVTEGNGQVMEEYKYDRAGNILWKKEGDTLTEYSYDRANQLVTATRNGEATEYAYDAAGRLVKEGARSYRYAGADKVQSVSEQGKELFHYDYWADGQLAHVQGVDGMNEEFLWDGLALVRRGAIDYLNEPSPTGGNPVAATGKVLFNDLLGTTIGAKSKDAVEKLPVSAFGAAADVAEHQFFTGKPHVQGLGYAFLMRNYRADLGKWQTADPLGYPDGWNNLAYCGNACIDAADLMGALTINLICNGQDASQGITCVGVSGLESVEEGFTTIGNAPFLKATYNANEQKVNLFYTCQYNTDVCKPYDAIKVGETNAYCNHNRSGTSTNHCMFEGNPIYDEAVKAHEVAHVQAAADYFSRKNVILQLEQLLSSNMKDGNVSDWIVGKCIQRLMDTAVFAELDCSYTNAATCNSYQQGWKLKFERDGVHIWIKE